jgi:hypothetical protein
MARDRRRKQFHFDSLERRDTPSVVVAAAVHHPKKPPPHHFVTAKLKAAGEAVLTSDSYDKTTLNVYVTSIASGSSKATGAFKGPLNVSFNLNGTTAFASGVFTNSKGSFNITFAVSGNLSQGTSFSGTYTIAGGAGKYALATGTGALSGSIDTADKSLSFDLTGKIKY